MARPKQTREPRRHLTIKEAAAQLGRSYAWMKQKIKEGEFESFADGRWPVTVSAESIVAWEEKHRTSRGLLKEGAT